MKDTGKKEIKTVLHILEPEPEGKIGGADMHVMELVKAQQDSSNFDNIIFMNQNSNFARLLEKNNIKYIFYEKKLGFIKHIIMLMKWLYSNKIDLIHSHGYDANYITFILKIFCKQIKFVPVVMTCHGWVKNNFMLIIKTYLDIWTHKIATALIFVSKDMVPQKSSQGRIISYIPNSVFERKVIKKLDIKHEFCLPSTTRLIGYIGRLSKEKRIDIFLRACKEIANEVKNVKFIIVGSGNEQAKLEALVLELGIQSKVIFTGLVLDYNLLANIYQEIEFLILTSDTEATPRVIIEAMSIRKPIIATNVGGIKELVIHGINGFLVNKEDYQTIARYGVHLLHNDCLRVAVGNKSYERYKENFTMSKEVKAVQEVYNDVIFYTKSINKK